MDRELGVGGLSRGDACWVLVLSLTGWLVGYECALSWGGFWVGVGSLVGWLVGYECALSWNGLWVLVGSLVRWILGDVVPNPGRL